MPEPKPPYKLTIKLDGAKPERIMEALTELREKMSEHDQTGEASVTMTIEAWQEAPLRAVLDAFETWLFYHAAGVDSEVTLKRPGVRPETIALLAREKHQTPMDVLLDDESALFPGQQKSTGERALDWLVEHEK